MFRARPMAYQDYLVKIDTALSYVTKDVAKDWATTQFLQLEHDLPSWEAFLAERDNQTPDEFFVLLNNLKPDAGFNDEALLDFLRVNIRPDLLEHAIHNSTIIEDTLSSWEAALRHYYDRHRRDFDLDRNDRVNCSRFWDSGGRNERRGSELSGG